MRTIIYRINRLKRGAGRYLNSRPVERWVCVGFFRARTAAEACELARNAIDDPRAIVRVEGIATQT